MPVSEVQKEKTIEPYPNILYVDTREPPIFMEKIAELCPIPMEAKQLLTGDYVCGNVAIERKTINDFCLSVIGRETEHNGRLFTQSERLGKEFPYHYILVTGTIDECTVNMHRHALLGALASVVAHGITVIFGLNNDDDFVYVLLKLFEKHGLLKMVNSRRKKKKEEPKPQTDVFVGVIN